MDLKNGTPGGLNPKQVFLSGGVTVEAEHIRKYSFVCFAPPQGLTIVEITTYNGPDLAKHLEVIANTIRAHQSRILRPL